MSNGEGGIQFGDPRSDPRIPREDDPLGEDFERGLFDVWIEETITDMFMSFVNGVNDISEYVSDKADQAFVDSPAAALELTKKGAGVLWDITGAALVMAGAFVFAHTIAKANDARDWAVGKVIGGVISGFSAVQQKGSDFMGLLLFGDQSGPTVTGPDVDRAVAIIDEATGRRRAGLPSEKGPTPTSVTFPGGFFPEVVE